jgi:hypothetical protein
MRVLLTVAVLIAALCAQPASGRAQGEAEPTPAPGEPRPAHPEPRVIVTVSAVRGPHDRAEVERAARLAWGRIVGCYKAIDRTARGAVALELVVSASGKVTSARRTRSTLEKRELATCLTTAMEGLAMPTARARSVASTEIQVAPGDQQ